LIYINNEVASRAGMQLQTTNERQEFMLGRWLVSRDTSKEPSEMHFGVALNLVDTGDKAPVLGEQRSAVRACNSRRLDLIAEKPFPVWRAVGEEKLEV
jgi:hypothetical protein